MHLGNPYVFRGAGARRRPARRLLRALLVAGAAGMIVPAGLAASTAAASGAGGRALAPSAKPHVVLGISMPFLNSGFEVVLEHQLVKRAHSLGMKVLSPTNANMDSGQQITDIRNLISEGANALLVDANDSKAIIPALAYAKQHKVPVVALDIGPEGGHVNMIVRADNIKIGELACKAIGRATHGTGKVLSLEGALTSVNGYDRTVGFRNCIKKNYPHITLIQKPTNWDATTQANDIQTVVTANPDLKAIYMQADWAVSAAMQTIYNSGHKATAGHPGHIFTVSVDGTPLGLNLVRQGHLNAEISQPLNYYVKYGLQYIEEAVAGKTFHTGHGPAGTVISKFDGNLQDLMPPTLVTKANVNSPNLWGNEH